MVIILRLIEINRNIEKVASISNVLGNGATWDNYAAVRIFDYIKENTRNKNALGG